MDAERNEFEEERRAREDISGPVLRATRRGALVLQTENARRMMQRLRHLRAVPEPKQRKTNGPAPAGP